MASKNIDVVAFNSSSEYTQDSLIIAVKQELAKRKRIPTILVFPELALGRTILTRKQLREFLFRLNGVLARHKKAFVFMSLLREMRVKDLPFVNAGYIVTPDRKKPWMDYPKIARWGGDGEAKRPTGFDLGVIQQLSLRKARGEVLKQRLNAIASRWIRVANLTKNFPSIFVNGVEFQLRVCADSCRHEGAPKGISESAHKPAVVIVPAKNLIQDDIDFMSWRRKIGPKATMVVVDGGFKNTRVLSHETGTRVHQEGKLQIHNKVRLSNTNPSQPIKKRLFGFFRRGR